jgi:hypothetical protein
MSGPFVFVSHGSIKPGKREDFEAWAAKFATWVGEREPRLLAFHSFVDEAGENYTSIQVHPDAASMEHHMRVLGEEIMATFDYVDSDRVEVYGEPSDAVRAMVSQIADVEVVVQSVHLAGVTRLGGS